jgi:S1-C subfamily serine protease
LFLSLQNIQSLPLFVKSFLPVLFLAFPASYRAATFLDAVLEKALERRLRQMPEKNRNRAIWLAALLGCLFCSLAANVASEEPADDASLSSAVCPIVYQLDQSPSSRGYHYSFFGNGFFINEEGYILTVAHVLEAFRNGGQPYILVSRPNSPPRLLQATVIAVDLEHDVAILRATSNPFAANYKVTFLPLSTELVSPGQPVLALSLHPPRQQNAHTFEVPREDRFSGEVLSYESTQLEKSASPAEVFLLSHPVTLGQSGSPVLALGSQAVVGLVEGRWLRSSGLSIAKSPSRSRSVPGAAIPVRYAIALLQRQSVSWHAPQAAQSAPPAR